MVNIGDEVVVIGRPYGDCPEMGFQLQNITPAGTNLKVSKVYSGPDGAELSDGFQYPATSFARLHTFVDGCCTYCLCLERDKDLLACMTMAEAKKAYDEAEPANEALRSWDEGRSDDFKEQIDAMTAYATDNLRNSENAA